MISQLIWGIMSDHEASDFCVIKLPDVLSNGFASEHSRPSKRSLKRKKAAAKKAAAKASEMVQHHWNHCPTSGSPKSNNNQMISNEWLQFQGPFLTFEELHICYTMCKTCVYAPKPQQKLTKKFSNSLEEKALASAAPTVPTESIDEIFAKRKPPESGEDLGRSTGDPF